MMGWIIKTPCEAGLHRESDFIRRRTSSIVDGFNKSAMLLTEHRAKRFVFLIQLLPNFYHSVVIIPVVSGACRPCRGIIIPCCIRQIRLTGAIDRNLIPFARRAVVIYTRKACAIIERIIANRRNAISDCNTRKAFALIERIIANRRNIIRNNKIGY